MNKNHKGTVNEKIIHISDWLPTLVNLAELNSELPNDLDGIDQTEAIFGTNSSTMYDFHNFGLIFAGQCTVCLKG